MLNKKLEAAFQCKNSNQPEEAMQLYQEVLASESLQSSHIDKHMFMRFNAHKNLGDVMANLKMYQESKFHFTEGLKIQPKDHLSWTKLGELQYDHFQDLKLAKQCFEAATRTYPTLDRQGSKMCPILKKLAEISVRQFQFKESEKIVDVIIQRSTSPQDKQYLLFAVLMKVYLLGLRAGENERRELQCYAQKAQELSPGSKPSDLEVIAKLAQMNKDICRPAVVQDSSTKQYVAISESSQPVIELESMPSENFLQFLEKFFEQLLRQIEPYLGDKKSLNQAVVDSSQVQEHYAKSMPVFQHVWTESFTATTPYTPVQLDGNESPQTLNQKKDKPKQLRKKLDNTEQQLRQIKLGHFNTYKQYVYDSFGHNVGELASTSEILQLKNLMQVSRTDSGLVQSGGQTVFNQVPNISVLKDFLTVLEKMHLQGVLYCLRNLLRYLAAANLVRTNSSVFVFKMFQICLENSEIENFDRNEVLLMMFELTLFNQNVIKSTKSGPIMAYRLQIYNYFDKNQVEIMSCISDPVKKVRLCYCMMFFAFEIKNDMSASVRFYKLLDVEYIRRNGPFPLLWVDYNFCLDFKSVQNFGSQKIREAQTIREFDQAIYRLKLSEFETTKSVYTRQVCPSDTVLFYLEQLFVYLTNLVQAHENSSSSVGVNFHTNEDKLKDMWDQLMYCLVRTPTNHFFKITNHIFCIFSAFNYLMKKDRNTFYELVLLKKLDFEILLSEISERLRGLVAESGLQASADLTDLAKTTESILIKELGVKMPQTTLNKLLVHLMRLLSPEFVYFNVKVGGSMANAPADPGQPFFAAFYRNLFYLELLRAIKIGKLESVTMLLKTLDHVAQDMPDLLMRSYSKLFIVAFPIVLRLHSDPSEVQFIQRSLNYLFGFKVKESGDDNEEMNSEPDDEIMVEECTQISLFGGFKPNGEKPKYPLLLPAQVFLQMVLTKKDLDIQLMADIVSSIDRMSEGRLLSQGRLTQADMVNCSKITETFAQLILMKKQDLQKKDVEAQNQAIYLKQCFRDNPFLVQEVKNHQNANLHCVIQFILNIFAHLGLQVSPYQIPVNHSRRQQLLDKLPSLRDLQKLRGLVQLDLQFTDNLQQTCLMRSMLDFQNYMQAVEAKLIDDYKHSEDYTTKQGFKYQAIHCSLWALKSSVQTQDAQVAKMALWQINQIVYTRLQNKRNKTNAKFFHIQNLARLVAFVCENIEKLFEPPTNDPRAQKVSKEVLTQQAWALIQLFLHFVRQSYVEIDQSGSKPFLVAQDKVQDCIAQVSASLSDFDVYLSKMNKANLTFDYPFIQATSFGDQLVDLYTMNTLKQAFDTAVSAKNSVAVFECLLLLIEKSLKITVELRYKLHPSDKNVPLLRKILDQVTKPALQDSDHFLNNFNQKKQDPNVFNSELEYLVHDKSQSQFVRIELMKDEPMSQSIDPYQAMMLKLYRTGDNCVTLLQNSQQKSAQSFAWLKYRFSKMLNASLFDEYLHYKDKNPGQARLIRESVSLVVKEVAATEEQLANFIDLLNGQPTYRVQHLIQCFNTNCQDSAAKSVVTFGSNSSLSEFKINLKKFLINLCTHSVEYEPLLQLYRRSYDSYKKSLVYPCEKLFEHCSLFHLSQDALFTTIDNHVIQLSSVFFKLRERFLQFAKGQQGKGFTEATQAFRDYRQKYATTALIIPQILKDAFELFVECHYSKQFLKKNNLVSNEQRITIRKVLLRVCAVCGPDQETQPGHKFLDFTKLESDEYFCEGLQVCLKWYINVLEAIWKKGKKELEMIRKVTATLDEIVHEISLVASQDQAEPVFKQELPVQKLFK